MSKYKEGNFLQLSRTIFPQSNIPPEQIKQDYKTLSPLSRWVYCCLSELEHRYSGKKVDYFFRSNGELAELAGVSQRTIQRSKAELKAAGFIHTWQMHYRDPETKKLSEKHISAYRIKA